MIYIRYPLYECCSPIPVDSLIAFFNLGDFYHNKFKGGLLLFQKLGVNMSEANPIFIGKKPVMNYVLACLTLFQNGSDSVIIKARGRAISKAVDVTQITIKRYSTGINVKKIITDTEKVTSNETGHVNNVSSIEIHLSR